MSTRLIQDLHAGISRRDWSAVEMAANRLRDDVEEMRRILAGTAISSLPNDYPLPRLATDALSTASPPETSACVLYGPYGYLNGHRALPEDTWTVEDDTIKNSEEYFSIPLYAKVEPVFPVSYSEPRATPEPVSVVEGEAAEIIRGFLSCPEIADCAPEDLDNEARDLERLARRFLASPPSDGELVRKAINKVLTAEQDFRDAMPDDGLVERLCKALEAAETYVIDGVTTAKQNLEMNAAYPARKPRYEAELQEARDIFQECRAARLAARSAKEGE